MRFRLPQSRLPRRYVGGVHVVGAGPVGLTSSPRQAFVRPASPALIKTSIPKRGIHMARLMRFRLPRSRLLRRYVGGVHVVGAGPVGLTSSPQQAFGPTCLAQTDKTTHQKSQNRIQPGCEIDDRRIPPPFRLTPRLDRTLYLLPGRLGPILR